MTIDFDPKTFSAAADPFPILAQLRREDPVHWSPKLKAWILTRYDDIQMCLRDDRYSSDRVQPFFDRMKAEDRAKLQSLAGLIPLWLVFRNSADHLRLRKLMNPAFLPAAIQRMTPAIGKLVDELIDGFAGRGKVEFISEFALLLPGSVILDMLGAPRTDLPKLKAWSEELALFIGVSQLTPEKYERAERGLMAMADYFRAIIRQKRDTPGEDVISSLIAARDAGDKLSEDELVASCILLLFGGHETTTNLLANSMIALIGHPEQLRSLEADPSLATQAVEECLRFDGPGGSVVRVVALDHELRGKTLLKGQKVFAMLPAANRDPERFPDPDAFNITRPDNRHLTFGQGPHFCLGAPLARTEGQIALKRLVERLGQFGIADETLEWHDAMIMRGVRRLNLTFSVKPVLAAADA